MRRRVKALLLAALMVASMFFTDIPFVNATETEDKVASGVTVSDSEVSAGETFEVEMVFPSVAEKSGSENYNKCVAMQSEVVFDNTAFEIVSWDYEIIDGNEVVTTVEKANELGKFTFLWQSAISSYSLENGYKFTAEVKVKDNAKGEFQFEVTKMVARNKDRVSLVETVDSPSVTINVVIPATSVTVDETLTLVEGETAALKAKVTPGNTTDKAVWTSSDETIAKVDADGNVTAVKPGEATITVTAGAVSATCKVTVTCSHKDTTKHDKVEPTCTTPGHEAYEVCNICGEVISGKNEEIPVAAHTPAEVISTDYEIKAATCTEKGLYYKSCSVCKVALTETFETGALGHAFTKNVEGKDASCEDDGVKAHYVCTRCDEISLDGEVPCTKEDTVIPALGHTLKHVEAKPATCTEKGNIEYWTCTVCKKFYADKDAKNEIIEKETIISETKHESTGVWETDENYHWQQCGGCGNLNKFEDGPHTFGDELASDGKLHWSECTVCGYEKDVEAHKGGSATCKEPATCTVCGVKYDDLGSHNFDKVVADEYLKSAATCTAKAVYFESCTVCKKAHEEVTFEDGEALGHAYEAVEEVAAKCEANGTKAHYVCTRCEVLSLDGKATCEASELVIPATGHTYADVQKDEYLKSAAGCEDKAVFYKSCTVCGKAHETETFETEALGHAYEAVEEVAAKCEANGTKAHYVCTRCEVLSLDGKATCEASELVIPATGHTFETVVKPEALKAAATCTSKAVYFESCTACDKLDTATFETGDVDATNHVNVEVKDAKEATCYEEGYTGETHCKDCGALVKTGEVVAMLPHKFGEWVVVKEATTTETGLKVRYCENKEAGCTAEETAEIDKVADKPTAPVTADNTAIAVWMGLAALALGTVVVETKKQRR